MIEVQMEMVQTESSQLSPSPSLNSYSSETLAEIAARVLQEFRRDPPSVSGDSLSGSWENDNFHVRHDGNGKADTGNDNDDEDFEFAFVCRDPKSSPVSADDIFYNGQIMPMYRLFDQRLLFSDGNKSGPGNGDVPSISPTQKTNETAPAPVRRRRLPLRKLMFEEQETGSFSSSTSEADDHDLDGVPPETYCVWTPKSAAADATERSRKKSNSTGSLSKRWKLLNLLIRSHSDGKEPPIVFLATSKRTNRVAHDVSKANEKPSSGGHNNSAAASSSEKEAKYNMRNRAKATAGKEGEQAKRKSYLPYRQQLVGLFSNSHGVNRKLHPF